MKQIITRIDDDLAGALKQQAERAGESVNSYVTRLLRTVTEMASAPPRPRELWKAAALADGRLVQRGHRRMAVMDSTSDVTTTAGYAAALISRGREDR